MFICLLACCRHAPTTPPAQPMIEVRQVRIDCLPGKPPLPQRVDFSGQGCPEPFAACISQEGARNLLRYIGELQQYAIEAWAMCGSEPLPEEY